MSILRTIDKAGYVTYLLKSETKDLSGIEITNNCFEYNNICLIFYLKGVAHRFEITKNEALELSDQLKQILKEID
jgi:hypothetical protein